MFLHTFICCPGLHQVALIGRLLKHSAVYSEYKPINNRLTFLSQLSQTSCKQSTDHKLKATWTVQFFADWYHFTDICEWNTPAIISHIQQNKMSSTPHILYRNCSYIGYWFERLASEVLKLLLQRLLACQLYLRQKAWLMEQLEWICL